MPKNDVMEAIEAGVELRRPDLYQDACFVCSTHTDPAATFSHPVIARWIGPYSEWKATRSAHQQDPCPVADVGRRCWQALRRWTAGSAVDFAVLDRTFVALGYGGLMPHDFDGHWLRRINYPWSPVQYSTRIALVFALANAQRVMSGKPALTDEMAAQQPGETLPQGLVLDEITGGNCPVCGGFGSGYAKGQSASSLRHAMHRRHRRALAKEAASIAVQISLFTDAQAGVDTRSHEVLLEQPHDTRASRPGRSDRGSADSDRSVPAASFSRGGGGLKRGMHRAVSLHQGQGHADSVPAQRISFVLGGVR